MTQNGRQARAARWIDSPHSIVVLDVAVDDKLGARVGGRRRDGLLAREGEGGRVKRHVPEGAMEGEDLSDVRPDLWAAHLAREANSGGGSE